MSLKNIYTIEVRDVVELHLTNKNGSKKEQW
jgi:hypothetical protein